MNVYSIELKVSMIQHKYITEYITSHRVSKTEWNFSELATVMTTQHMGQSFVVFHLQQLVSDELMDVQRARLAQVDAARDGLCYMDADDAEMDAPCAYFSLALERFLSKKAGHGGMYPQETYIEIEKTLELVSCNFWNMPAEEQDRKTANTELEREVGYFQFCM